MPENAVVSQRGARRWESGHPWIFRSDVVQRPDAEPGAVVVTAQNGRPLGVALWSPASEISLRLIDRDPRATIDLDWWRRRLGAAVARREPLRASASAYRLAHGEGDAVPSLVVDRYDRWLVVQLLSAGVEAFRAEITTALLELTGAEGILDRKSTRLNSSHVEISYAVFCLKKKTKHITQI